MEYEKQAYSSNNMDFVTSTALQIRLETSRQLQQLKEYLSGEIEIIKEENGEIIRVTTKYGNPKANNRGIQSILSRVSLLLNPSVVQGNFTEETYNRQMYQTRLSLADELMLNLQDYEIRIEDYEGIIDSIMDMLKAFMSRLINNEERKSYDNTIRHIEKDSQTFSKKERGLI